MIPTFVNTSHREFYKTQLPLMSKAMKSVFDISDEQLSEEKVQNWMLDAAVILTDEVDEFPGETPELRNSRKANEDIYKGRLDELVISMRESFPQWRDEDKWSLTFRVLDRYYALKDELIQIDTEEATDVSTGAEVVSEADKTEEIPIESTDTPSVPDTVISEEVSEPEDRPEVVETEPEVVAEEVHTTEPVEEVVEEVMIDVVAEAVPTVTETSEVPPTPPVVEKAVIPEALTQKSEGGTSKLTLTAEPQSATESKPSGLTETVMADAKRQSTSTDAGEVPASAVVTNPHQTAKSEERQIDDNSSKSITGNVSVKPDELLQNSYLKENTKMSNPTFNSAANAMTKGQTSAFAAKSASMPKASNFDSADVLKFLNQNHAESSKAFTASNTVSKVIIKEVPVVERQNVTPWHKPNDSRYIINTVAGQLLNPESEKVSGTKYIEEAIARVIQQTGYTEFVPTAVDELGEGGDATVDTRSYMEMFPHCVSEKDARIASIVMKYLESLKNSPDMNALAVTCKARKASAPVLGVFLRSPEGEETLSQNQLVAVLSTKTTAIYAEETMNEETKDRVTFRARKIAAVGKSESNTKQKSPQGQKKDKIALDKNGKYLPTLLISNRNRLFGEDSAVTTVPYFETDKTTKLVKELVIIPEMEVINGVETIVNYVEAKFQTYVSDGKGGYEKDTKKASQATLVRDKKDAKDLLKKKTFRLSAYVETAATESNPNPVLGDFKPDKEQKSSNTIKDSVDYLTDANFENSAQYTQLVAIKEGKLDINAIGDASIKASLEDLLKSYDSWAATAATTAEATPAEAPAPAPAPAPGSAPKAPEVK